MGLAHGHTATTNRYTSATHIHPACNTYASAGQDIHTPASRDTDYRTGGCCHSYADLGFNGDTDPRSSTRWFFSG